jgi:hypothetical protein
MAQTAVEWLALRYHHRQGYLSQEDIEQAKQMEKEQIEKAYLNGCLRVTPYGYYNDSAEQYFKKTYGKEMQ